MIDFLAVLEYNARLTIISTIHKRRMKMKKIVPYVIFVVVFLLPNLAFAKGGGGIGNYIRARVDMAYKEGFVAGAASTVGDATVVIVVSLALIVGLVIGYSIGKHKRPIQVS
jgi:hypothetical protein